MLCSILVISNVAITDFSIFIIKVAVRMHEHGHSCTHVSMLNKTLFAN